MKILSTKTLPATIFSFAKQKEISLTCLNFIQTNAIPFSVTEINSINCDTLVFTSSNAVKYFSENQFAKQLLTSKNIFSLVLASSIN